MNEIEQIVKALDVFEDLRDIDENTMTNSNLNDVFIINTDIKSMKIFLKNALEQLENLKIDVRKEE